jgi:hypothetical protein
MIALKSDLTSQLKNVDEYLNAGTAVTMVSYYDANGNFVYSSGKRSKWTTALGKNKVILWHEEFISTYSSGRYAPANAQTIKIESPFIEDGEFNKEVPYTAYRQIQVVAARV